MFAQRKTRSEGSVPKTVAKETVAGGGGTINKKKDNNNKKTKKQTKKTTNFFCELFMAFVVTALNFYES